MMVLDLHEENNNCRRRRMGSITIGNLDDGLEARLRVRAAIHDKSMEDEARDILRNALSIVPSEPHNLAEAIRARFAPLGGVEFPEVHRDAMRAPPSFEG
jgi:plasmid stability protein